MASSAWLYPTTQADTGGMNSTPDSGGHDVTWTYETNHISDGELAECVGGGAVTDHLDNSTVYDGVDTTHTQPRLMECGLQMRAILC